MSIVCKVCILSFLMLPVDEQNEILAIEGVNDLSPVLQVGITCSLHNNRDE